MNQEVDNATLLAAGAPLPDAAGFLILSHFLADLSVENPRGRPPEELVEHIRSEAGVHVSTVPLDLPDSHRVDIFVRLTALAGDHAIFVAELNYRAEVKLHQIAEADMAKVLRVTVPETLFPLIKEIFETCGRFAGYPELIIHALEFSAPFAISASPQ